MTSAHQRAAHMLAVGADLLEQGQVINRLSVAATAIGLGVLLLPVFPASPAMAPMAMLVAVAGLGELFLAMRVGLDAALFRRLAADAADDRLNLAALEEALTALKLKSDHASWSIAARLSGARRLLMLQGIALFIQVLAAMAGGLAVFLEYI